MNAWLSIQSNGVAYMWLLSIALLSVYHGTSILTIIGPAAVLDPVEALAPALLPMAGRTRTQTQRQTQTLVQGSHLFASKDCGAGFHAESTGPNDEEVCVYDYDDVNTNADNNANANAVVVVDEEALKLQNKARRNFGLPALTPQQFLALQAETQDIISKQIEDVASKVFREFDQNGDGVITRSELNEGLLKYFGTQYLNPSLVTNGDAIVAKVMDHFDMNGDGLLQPDEFVPIEELRTLLKEVIASDGVQAPTEREQQQQQQEQQQEANVGGVGLFQSLFNTVFQDTCQNNSDCERPTVCCDYGYKKTCCNSGEGQLTPAMMYAVISPSKSSPGDIPPPPQGGGNIYGNNRY